MTRRRRFAQVGIGSRAWLYTDALAKNHIDETELVGICDINPGRATLGAEQIRAMQGTVVPIYAAADFDRMIKETRPDAVIVTTRDSHHDEYVCRAMELGCDAITEKPMTTDEKKCQMILDTQRKTGRKVTVTFNYRYSPPRTQIKDLLMKGVIGDVLSVDFHWMLDIHHGADYFRRWHRNKANSGGLMVHKATHHFDLVNWWLSSVPERVLASGHRNFYTPQTAERMGLSRRTERCHTCPHLGECAFGIDMTKIGDLKRVYMDHEHHDGYLRDRCVFGSDINIEDNMNVIVDYENGTKLSYSLNAFMPWEGYVVCFNGTQGRLEHKCEESVYISGDATVPGAFKPDGTYTRVFPHRKPAYALDVWHAEGGHGGGDEPLVCDALGISKTLDPYKRAADQRSGAWSILIGVAANRAMAEGRPIRIDELCQNIGMPDYPAMPSKELPLRFPMPAA